MPGVCTKNGSQGHLLYGWRRSTTTMHPQQNQCRRTTVREVLGNHQLTKNTNPKPAPLQERLPTQEHSCSRLPRIWLKSRGQVQLGLEPCLWSDTSHPSSDSHSLANATVSRASVQEYERAQHNQSSKGGSFCPSRSWLPDLANKPH